jgi:hypothetical protein
MPVRLTRRPIGANVVELMVTARGPAGHCPVLTAPRRARRTASRSWRRCDITGVARVGVLGARLRVAGGVSLAEPPWDPRGSRNRKRLHSAIGYRTPFEAHSAYRVEKQTA